MPKLPEDPVIRFWRLVKRQPGCWIPHNPRKGGGYWTFEDTYAHRFSWMLANGEIPQGLWVLHKCDNPLCVKPRHLFLGTPKDNVDDMWAKGRANPPQGYIVGIAARCAIDPTESQGEKNGHSKLTDEQIQEIRFRYSRVSYRVSNSEELAREFGVSSVQILKIAKGRAWKHLDLS